MLTRDNIKKRTLEVMQTMAKRADITEEKILSDYQRALAMAEAQEKPSDMVNAATAQAKLVGMLKDRIETKNVDFEGIDSIAEILQVVAEQAGPEVAMALSRAFNLVPIEEGKPINAVREEVAGEVRKVARQPDPAPFKDDIEGQMLEEAIALVRAKSPSGSVN
jgi:hypothetical protein